MANHIKKIAMMEIKNLLFDLGGVVMDIRKENCVEAFRQLGLRNASSYFGDYSQQGPFLALERGDITEAEFHAELRKDLPEGVGDSAIDEAFCKFLVGVPPRRLDELEALGKRFNVCLLSNTNPIMWHSTIRHEFEKKGFNMEHYFPGGMVTSFEAKAVKPDPKIFEFTIKKLGIRPEETLFLDDSQANLDSAAKLGFHTALVPTDTEFIEVLHKTLPNL